VNLLRVGKGETPADRADHQNRAEKEAIAATIVAHRDGDQHDRRRDQDPQRERAHRAEVIEVRKQTPDARRGEDNTTARPAGDHCTNEGSFSDKGLLEKRYFRLARITSMGLLLLGMTSILRRGFSH